MFAAIGVLAALSARARTGEGQWVDTSLLETPIAWSIYEAASYFATGQVPGRLGPGHRAGAPYQAFRTRDGWLNLGGGSPRFWPRICEVIGVPDLADDPRFKALADRVRNRKELEALLEARFVTDTTEAWLERLEAVGVPAGPILTYDQVFADPQVVHRDMVVVVDHPTAGPSRVLGIPIKLSGTPGSIRRPAPTLGQHTDEVLGELGLTAAEIARLRAERVV
jgi:crotonobetainyl-CoA:carnitine CoA-transferase CaiB-like acyl-CoA transferase